ncbi:hypothetical protein T06_6809 [Trichinella sp. T6]|nr:hypothetical protein T06_6809 [Trichinella sp. T6]
MATIKTWDTDGTFKVFINSFLSSMPLWRGQSLSTNNNL